MISRPFLRALPALPIVFLLACGPSEVEGTQASFDLQADVSQPENFFALPWPMDWRGLDYAKFPNPADNVVVRGMSAIAQERRGFPMNAAAYFLFSAPLAPRDPSAIIPAKSSSPILLVDADPASPTLGALLPTTSSTLEADDYVPSNLLAVAPWPGTILAPNHTYAYVILRSLNDAAGEELGSSLVFEQLKAGESDPKWVPGAVPALYAKAWKALEKAGVDLDDVAAATVFTTGDVVADLEALGTKMRDAHPVEITGLSVDEDDGDHGRFCELVGKIAYPQFQRGTQPFNSEGLFDFGADGLPKQQGQLEVPVTITLPKGTMPAAGFPLMVYFHGSGGTSAEVVDRGRIEAPGGLAKVGEGPAFVVAPIGLATASTALPVNPERLPGASDFAYLNIANFPAMRDTFRQGVYEQRAFIEALTKLEIPPEALAGCTGITLPAGAKAKLDPSKFVAMGHSMGAMYANMIIATEPRLRAAVPVGAGGYWSFFLLHTDKLPSADLLGNVLGTPAKLNYLHPVLQVVEAAFEPVDPIVYTPRLARRPLPGFPVRSIFEPAGRKDPYFQEPIFDALALGYGNQQAGTEVWPTMQQSLALDGRQGLAPYPISANRRSETGEAFTGVVVQFEGDGNVSSHSGAFQLDAIKYQYGCFLRSFLETGTARVPGPGTPGDACP